MALTPTYITIDDVKPWLYGKVAFGTDPVTTITDTFLGTLCAYAESEVLADLRYFYTTPLQDKDTGEYSDLPVETRGYLEQLFVLKAVDKVLKEEFGREGTVIGDNYFETIGSDYKTEMNKMFKKGKDGRYMIYPLPQLKLNPYNYTGMTVMPAPQVVNTYPNVGQNMDFAINQITRPYASWWSFMPYGAETTAT
jgi:hypothetical protein